jgi:hypothetical protein
VLPEFIWLRTGSSGRLMWTRRWIHEFYKKWGIFSTSDRLVACEGKSCSTWLNSFLNYIKYSMHYVRSSVRRSPMLKAKLCYFVIAEANFCPLSFIPENLLLWKKLQIYARIANSYSASTGYKEWLFNNISDFKLVESNKPYYYLQIKEFNTRRPRPLTEILTLRQPGMWRAVTWCIDARVFFLITASILKNTSSPLKMDIFHRNVGIHLPDYIVSYGKARVSLGMLTVAFDRPDSVTICLWLSPV